MSIKHSMRAMKDSGVEWIGKIPEAWEVRKVAQFWKASKGPNAALLTAEYCGEHSGQYPVYSGQTENNGVMGMINSYIFDFGTTGCLFSTTVGAKAMSVSCLYGKFSLSQNCMIMQPITGNCDVRYFFYLFTFIFGYYRSLIPDNMQPSFRIKDFYAYSMLMPSEIEQKEIAVYLDTKCVEIDKVVEQTRATIEEYKKLKQAIITEAVTKGVRGARPMKPSGVEWIGDIPEDWSMKRFKYLGTYRNGLTYKPEDMVDTGTLVLRSSNIQNGQIVLDDNVYVSCAVRDELKVRKGDILICSRNGSRELIGKNAIIKDDMDASFGAFMMIFRSDSPEYVRYILNSSVFSYYLASFFTATINQLTASNFGNMKVPFCCDLIEQKEIVAFLDTKCAEIDRIIEKKEQLIEELGSYKKSLIYEYVTGKKEIKIHNYSQNTIC